MERLEAEVFLADGRRVAGVLLDQTTETVTLLIAGIATPFNRTDIDRVKLLPSIVDQYLKLKSSIDERNLPARIELVRWLMARDCLDTALLEIRAALETEPANPDALELQTLVTKQIELRDKAAARAQRTKEGVVAPDPKLSTKAAAARQKFPLLTKDDINSIRVFELDLNDPPRMSLSRDALTRFLDAYAGQEGVPTTREGRDALARRPVADIVRLMFKLRARDFYTEVKVLDNPRSMQLFRDNIHRPWLLSGCATTQCHGGEDAGRLLLASRLTTSDALEYTNFFILDQFRLADGSPLIDYARPERSPLLQMGLPLDLSLNRHPEVANFKGKSLWRPVFSSPDDPRFRDAVAWIESMYKPRPTYPVAYTAPRPSRPPQNPGDPNPASTNPAPSEDPPSLLDPAPAPTKPPPPPTPTPKPTPKPPPGDGPG